MIRTKTTISGIEYFDYDYLEIGKTTSDNNTSSYFTLHYDTPYGRHKTDFTVGNEVKIFADKDATPTTNIFTGILENVGFTGEGLDERLELRGRDYTARLMDQTVQPVVYTNTGAGSIVRDILKNNTTDIGSVNVYDTTAIISRIAFNQVNIFDAIKQLADISNYIFYIDNNKDLHFEQGGSFFTGSTLDNTSIISSTFDKTREGMYNRIWVYGDRQLSSAPREVFTVTNQGSVFTLTYPPFNTEVRTSLSVGSIIKGDVFNRILSTTSGPDYLVSFDDKQIILRSGTQLGYSSLPANTGSVVVDYQRQTPIVKYGESKTSIDNFGPKTLVINDKSIKDPVTASAIVANKLSLVNPLNNIELRLNGWHTFSPGQTINVSLPNFNINQSGLTILDMRYVFDPESMNSENVLTVKLERKQIDLTDKIRDMNKRLNDLEASDRLSSDIFTRLQFATGSLLVVGSRWYIAQRFLGSEFILWGSNSVGAKQSGGQTLLGLLYSGAGITGSNSYLASGTYFNTTIINTSGGYAYPPAPSGEPFGPPVHWVHASLF